MAPLQDSDTPLFHVERISQYVSLSPASLSHPLPAICASIFSPLLLSYFPPARGIVLAFENVELSSSPPSAAQAASKSKYSSKSKSKSSRSDSQSQQQSQQESGEPPQQQLLLLQHIDEYTSPFLWATASLLIWRPVRNAYLTARTTHQSKTHITLAHLNTFPVSVLKEHFPNNWTWHAEEAGRVKKGWDGRPSDEGGWWVDEEGERVGGDVRVRIRDVDGRMDGRGRGNGLLRVEGSLVSLEEERARVRDKGKRRA